MKHTIFFALAVMVVSSNAPRAADYWPVNAGSVYHYDHDSGGTYEVTYTDCCRVTFTPGPDTYNHEYFSVNEVGDVISTGSYVGSVHMPCGESEYYNPPILFLDFPLEVGKTWSTTTEITGDYPYPYPEFRTYAYVVLLQETVVVPAGEFPVFVVKETMSTSSWIYEYVYYLDQELGPVALGDSLKLAWISGGVGVEKSSLGGLKAMYR